MESESSRRNDHNFDDLEVAGHRTFSANMPRGARMLMTLGCAVGVLLVILIILVIVNTASTTTRASKDQSVIDRLAYLTGLMRVHAAHLYTFVRVYDSKTLERVTDERVLLDGLPSGSAPAIVKGWVELLFASEATASPGDSSVSYNITVVHPDATLKHGVTALELVVMQFNMKSEKPMEKAAVTLCGGASGVQCSIFNAVIARKDQYSGAGVLPANFDTLALGDALHTTYLLLVYMGESATATTLLTEELRFVIELEA